jgi:hypothetical protein
MDQLLEALLIPCTTGRLTPLISLAQGQQRTMAGAVSSPFSSQEQHDLPLRAHLDTNPFASCPSGQASLAQDNAFHFDDSGSAGLSYLQDIADFERETGTNFTLLRSKKAKTENIVKLQQRGDKQQIRPHYDVQEVFQQNFKAKVLYAGEIFETATLCRSKDEARDAVAKVALEHLPCIENKQVAGQKRKSDDRTPSPIDKSENWIGLLMQNHQQKKTFEPDYLEHESSDRPPRFFCEIKLNGGPLQLFNAGIFLRKQDAKAASAKLAVEWLRREGHLEMRTMRPRTEPNLLHTGPTQAIATVAMDKEPPTKPMRFRQRVYELTASLGFQQPTCQPTLSVMHGVPGGSFYDAESIFKAIDVEREPALAGPIGRVQHVHGKDNAKEACSERVLPVLEEIKRRRLEQGMN